MNIYSGNLQCGCLCDCVRVPLSVGAWICVSVETRGWCQLPSLIFLHIITINNIIAIILKQSLSMNLELTDWARVAEQQAQGSSCVWLLCAGFTGIGFYRSVGDQNLGVHACTIALTNWAISPTLEFSFYKVTALWIFQGWQTAEGVNFDLWKGACLCLRRECPGLLILPGISFNPCFVSENNAS